MKISKAYGNYMTSSLAMKMLETSIEAQNVLLLRRNDLIALEGIHVDLEDCVARLQMWRDVEFQYREWIKDN